MSVAEKTVNVEVSSTAKKYTQYTTKLLVTIIWVTVPFGLHHHSSSHPPRKLIWQGKQGEGIMGAGRLLKKGDPVVMAGFLPPFSPWSCGGKLASEDPRRLMQG